MAEAVYLLCAIFSAACAALLFRGYSASRARLLFWSGLCFCGLVVNNLLLFFDLVVVPQQDLTIVRSVSALVSVTVLVIGLVWEAT
jgi:hypothetical protein